jgi:cell division protein FtsI (penicillin-binding protein 3)
VKVTTPTPQNRMRAPKPDVRARLNVLIAGFGAFAALLMVRAVWLQVVDTEFYQAAGEERFVRDVDVPAYRGPILDRNGEPLAISTPVHSIWANPKELLQVQARLPELAEALQVNLDELRNKLIERQSQKFVYLRRQLPPGQAQQVMALKLDGVYQREEFRRFYPGGEVFAHVLGFTNVDDLGQEGIELAYDDWLRGKPGKKQIIRDLHGQRVRTVSELSAATPGKTLQLSLDRRIQYLAYRELKAAVFEHSANSGSVVVIDVPSGEILAMVNQPSYNPNVRFDQRLPAMRNRAMTDVFEPGSTMKPFTVAAALELGKVTPQTLVHTAPGRLSVANLTVRDVNNYGTLDVTHVLTKSSNVGATLLAQMLPNDHLHDVFQRFGFGQLTGTGFPGESQGFLPDWRSWGPVEKATLSYGYGLNVTALQLAQAYAALAADGRMHPPSFVKGAALKAESKIDPSIALTVTAMLETVTGPGGTAQTARINGYRVSGKTGTSRKASAHGYQNRYIGIFAGYAPATHPRIATVVIINDPLGQQYYGGLIAAPAFAKIVGGALRLLGEAPDGTTDGPLMMAEQVNQDAAEAVFDPVLQ